MPCVCTANTFSSSSVQPALFAVASVPCPPPTWMVCALLEYLPPPQTESSDMSSVIWSKLCWRTSGSTKNHNVATIDTQTRNARVRRTPPTWQTHTGAAVHIFPCDLVAGNQASANVQMAPAHVGRLFMPMWHSSHQQKYETVLQSAQRANRLRAFWHIANNLIVSVHCRLNLGFLYISEGHSGFLPHEVTKHCGIGKVICHSCE